MDQHQYVTREEFDDLVARQDRAEAAQHEMRQDIKQIRHDTHEVVEMFRTLSGGFRFFLRLGKLAAPLTAIAGAFTVFKNGWFK